MVDCERFHAVMMRMHGGTEIVANQMNVEPLAPEEGIMLKSAHYATTRTGA